MFQPEPLGLSTRLTSRATMRRSTGDVSRPRGRNMSRAAFGIAALLAAASLCGQNYDCLRGPLVLNVSVSGTAAGGYSSCDARTTGGSILLWQFYSIHATAGQELLVKFSVTGADLGLAAFYYDTTMTANPLALRVADCTAGCILTYTAQTTATYYLQIGGALSLRPGPVSYTVMVTDAAHPPTPTPTPTAGSPTPTRTPTQVTRQRVAGPSGDPVPRTIPFRRRD